MFFHSDYLLFYFKQYIDKIHSFLQTKKKNQSHTKNQTAIDINFYPVSFKVLYEQKYVKYMNSRMKMAHNTCIWKKTTKASGFIHATYFFSDFVWKSVNCLKSSLISWPFVAFWRVCSWAQFAHIGSGSSQVLQKCVASVWMFPQRQGSQNTGFPVSWFSLLIVFLND